MIDGTPETGKTLQFAEEGGKHKGRTETLANKQAFRAYYTLGKDRNYMRVAELMNVTQLTIKNWSKAFNWQLRVRLLDACETLFDREQLLDKYTAIEKDDAMMSLFGTAANIAKWTCDSAVQECLKNLLVQMSIMLETCFDTQNGKLVPKFEIWSAKDYAQIVSAYTRTLTLYQGLEAAKDPKGKGKGKMADVMNIVFGNNLSTEEQLATLQRIRSQQSESGRTGGSGGEVQEADYQEVSDGGVTDTTGRGTVPECSQGASSGEQGHVQEPRPHSTPDSTDEGTPE